MQLYYTPNIAENNFLDKTESQHLIKVLRKNVGDKIYSTNGNGNFYELAIVDANPKKLTFKIINETLKDKPKPNFDLYIALTKNINRIEWLIEKCTEIGISNIYPILCKNSERKHFRKDRLERIIISAIKQSQKYYLPKITEMQKFADAIKNLETKSNFIASYQKENNFLDDSLVKNENVSVFIGPEGDFNDKELQIAKENNLNCVNLSHQRLRTETAALVACQTFNALNR